jgi:hypothetical protein
MAESIPLFRVFLSSPSDVSEERALAMQTLGHLSREHPLRERAALEVVAWDEPSLVPLSASLTPQEAINRGIYRPAECDIVIFILWSRMGAPLPDDFRKPDGHRYMSGLEWEYDNAYTASPRPDVLIYRRTEAPTISLADSNFEDRRHQYQLVEQFFKRFRAEEDGHLLGGFNSYQNPVDFQRQLEKHVRSLALRRIEEVQKVSSKLHLTIPAVSGHTRRSIFISYSHADEYWLERLKIHLRPLEREGDVEYWDDTKIRPGALWRDEIKSAIARTRVAVLLVSADFLASEFISANELPPLLEAAAAEGAVILPVLVSPSRFKKTLSLSRFQPVNLPSEPLIGMSRAESEATLVKVTDAIEEAIVGQSAA